MKVFQVDRLKNALVVTLSIQVFVQAIEVLHSARDFFRHRKSEIVTEENIRHKIDLCG